MPRTLSPATKPGYHAGRRPANAGKTFPAEILSPAEVGALLRACSSTSSVGARNRALITILYRGGLRISEALALEPKDMDPVQGTIAVLHGKGDRRRTVGLDPEAVAIIERWLDARRRLGLHRRRSELLCTLQGRRLSESYVRALFPRLAARAGIEKRVHPHGLRHTHAAELAAEGFPLNLIQQQLGHANLATTDRYLRHVAPAQLIGAIQRRTWHVPAPQDSPAADRFA
jgi:site-specific recombinase XerD